MFITKVTNKKSVNRYEGFLLYEVITPNIKTIELFDVEYVVAKNVKEIIDAYDGDSKKMSIKYLSEYELPLIGINVPKDGYGCGNKD